MKKLLLNRRNVILTALLITVAFFAACDLSDVADAAGDILASETIESCIMDDLAYEGTSLSFCADWTKAIPLTPETACEAMSLTAAEIRKDTPCSTEEKENTFAKCVVDSSKAEITVYYTMALADIGQDNTALDTAAQLHCENVIGTVYDVEFVDL